MDGTNDTWQNLRAWHPGEPLDWARPGLLDSLLEEKFDNFSITVESPRQERYFKLIRYTSHADREALFVEGDLRYICTDIPSRKNASQSIVVGYSHGTQVYWYNGELCFQNGASNWYRHAHRHYHSMANGQIEMRETTAAPDGAEKAVVFSSDSCSYFIVFDGKLEEAIQPALVYSLRHDQSDWKFLGALHPTIRRLFQDSRMTSLKDYWTLIYSGTATVIRKSDLSLTQVPSVLALERKRAFEMNSSYANSWRAVRGNTLEFSWKEGKVTEDFDSLVSKTQWRPLTVPHALESEEWGLKSWTKWLPPLISVLLALALAGVLWKVKSTRSPSFPPPLPADEQRGLPSDRLQGLLRIPNSNVSTQELDMILGLDNVYSDETRRSRRSRLIQLINAESTALYGAPVILRTRSEKDKRVIIYLIASFNSEV